MSERLKLIVAGVRFGFRDDSEPLSLVEAFHRYRGLLALGYEHLTVTDADTGEAFDADGFAPPTLRRRPQDERFAAAPACA